MYDGSGSSSIVQDGDFLLRTKGMLRIVELSRRAREQLDAASEQQTRLLPFEAAIHEQKCTDLVPNTRRLPCSTQCEPGLTRRELSVLPPGSSRMRVLCTMRIIMSIITPFVSTPYPRFSPCKVRVLIDCTVEGGVRINMPLLWTVCVTLCLDSRTPLFVWNPHRPSRVRAMYVLKTRCLIRTPPLPNATTTNASTSSVA